MTRVEQICEQWQDVRNGLIKEVELIPAEQFEFRAAPETRSVLELIQHIIESERVLVGESRPMSRLDATRAEKLAALCEAIVPGSAGVGPVVYIDALLGHMPPPVREHALASIDALDPENLVAQERTAEFAFVRALAIEAYYSDFVAPGSDAPGAWADIGFDPPAARRLRKDWSWLGVS